MAKFYFNQTPKHRPFIKVRKTHKWKQNIGNELLITVRFENENNQKGINCRRQPNASSEIAKDTERK